VRTVADLPRGVALGVAREARCPLTDASLALAEITFRPQGVPASISPRLMPGDEACRKTALVLFGLSRAAADSIPPAGTADRLAVVLDADALAATDEAPVDAPEPRAVEGGVKEPKEVRRVKPAYPESLRRQRLEGASVLTARIDREGRIADLRVAEPAGTLATLGRDGTSLDLEALRAVARWRYEPAFLDGQPVPVLLSVSISWAVSGQGMAAPDASMRR
jgi:TonB family protein